MTPMSFSYYYYYYYYYYTLSMTPMSFSRLGPSHWSSKHWFELGLGLRLGLGLGLGLGLAGSSTWYMLILFSRAMRRSLRT